MVSDRVMSLIVFVEDVLRLICGYASQSGRSLEEKESFYDEVKCDEVCWKKRGRRSKGDTWWCNEEV